MGGKFVIVGVTAEGIANPAIQEAICIQHIQAHMLQNFIDGSNIQRSQLSSLIELLCALCGMILIALAIYKLPISAGLVTTVTILGGIVYYSVWLYC